MCSPVSVASGSAAEWPWRFCCSWGASSRRRRDHSFLVHPIREGAVQQAEHARAPPKRAARRLGKEQARGIRFAADGHSVPAAVWQRGRLRLVGKSYLREPRPAISARLARARDMKMMQRKIICRFRSRLLPRTLNISRMRSKFVVASRLNKCACLGLHAVSWDEANLLR